MVAYTEASAFPIPYSHNLFLVHFAYAIYDGKFKVHQCVSAPFIGTTHQGEIRAIICAYQYNKQIEAIFTDYGENFKKLVSKDISKISEENRCFGQLIKDSAPKRLLNILQRVGREDKSTEHYERYNRLHSLLKSQGKKAIEKFT